MGGQVAGDGRQHADKGDGHDEAGPAVPVFGGRHEGEENLPEDGEEMHDVVEARGQALLATLLLIVVSCRSNGRENEMLRGVKRVQLIGLLNLTTLYR